MSNKYDRIRGAKCTLGIIAVLAAILLLTGCGAKQSNSQPNLSDQPSNSSQSDTSDQATPSTPNQSTPSTPSDGNDNANKDPAKDPITTPTDHTYWRLVHQDELSAPYQIAASIQLGRESRRQQYPNLTSFPEFDFISEPATNFSANGYIIHATDAEPGEIISRIHHPKVEYVISVPILDETLAEYLDGRGDDYFMIHTAYPDGRQEARLAIYQKSTTIIMLVGGTDDSISVMASSGYFGSFAELSAYTTGGEREELDWRCDIVNVGCHGDGCCGESIIHLIYDEVGYNLSIAKHPEAAKAPEDGERPQISVSDEMAQFTETSYTVSPAQLQYLQEMIAEFEARPLPESVLARIAS